MAVSMMACTCIIVLTIIPLVSARLGSTAGTHTRFDREELGEDLQRALDTVLGCGDSVDLERLAEIKQTLLPMWRSLPKNSNGRVDWRSLRYTAHRFFMQRSSLMIRGFEPAHLVNESHAGHANILSQQIPALATLLLGGEQVTRGFSLEDAVDLVATLERLMFEAETVLLMKAYQVGGKSPKDKLTRDEIVGLIEIYMVGWVFGVDGLDMFIQDPMRVREAFPQYKELIGFIDGRIRTLDFTRQRAQTRHQGRNVFGHSYSFGDAHDVVGGITTSFASYWESECSAMKAQLVEMDKTGSGRVRLSDFYGTGLEKESRFAESEVYLRELGVLDETNSWRGKQVIISNYMQATSNCIVSTPHYMVCCVNECEGLLGEIEAEIGAPTASPSDLARVVGNMSSPSSEDDDPPKLEGALTQQLGEIAVLYGGEVPLHGRLFAQWLHYVFPRECTFPHKAGSWSTQSPMEFDGATASEEEMYAHAQATASSADSHNAVDVAMNDADWMSQWSEEEEFFADYSTQLQLRTPSDGRSHLSVGVAALGAVLIAVRAGISRGTASVTSMLDSGACNAHSHLV